MTSPTYPELREDLMTMIETMTPGQIAKLRDNPTWIDLGTLFTAITLRMIRLGFDPVEQHDLMDLNDRLHTRPKSDL